MFFNSEERVDFRDLVRDLARQADVVVENNRPGAMARLGLGYEQFAERHPSLVYCSVAGYPDDGPDASRPGFDFAIQGEICGQGIQKNRLGLPAPVAGRAKLFEGEAAGLLVEEAHEGGLEVPRVAAVGCFVRDLELRADATANTPPARSVACTARSVEAGSGRC